MNYYRNLNNDAIMKLILDNKHEVFIYNENDLSKVCGNGNGDTKIILDNYNFTKNNVYDIEFLPAWNLTTIPDMFLNYFQNLHNINKIPEGVTIVGANFMSVCTNFNSTLIFPNSLSEIGINFFTSNISFNQSLDFSNTNIKNIPINFLYHNDVFNSSLKMPLNIISTDSVIIYFNPNFTGPFICDMSFVNALPTPSSDNARWKQTLAVYDNPTCNSYTQGIRCKVIDGTFEALHEKLPDLNNDNKFYRKLIEYNE